MNHLNEGENDKIINWQVSKTQLALVWQGFHDDRIMYKDGIDMICNNTMTEYFSHAVI